MEAGRKRASIEGVEMIKGVITSSCNSDFIYDASLREITKT